LITWEGEKTLTFTVEDALLSPMGFSILSGANLFNKKNEPVHVHRTVKSSILTEGGSERTIKDYYQRNLTTGKYDRVTDPIIIANIEELDTIHDANDANDNVVTTTTNPATMTGITNSNPLFYIYSHTDSASYYIDLNGSGLENKKLDIKAPIFITLMKDDSLTGERLLIDTTNATTSGDKQYIDLGSSPRIDIKLDSQGKGIFNDDVNVAATAIADAVDEPVFVDFYTIEPSEANAMELQINAEDFAGYFYVEADTLVRRQSDGRDLPAILTIPNVKIQSNFSITMASSGDPSTFTFTMDAMPGYTYFNNKDKVLCVFQIIDESEAVKERTAVMRTTHGHNNFDENNPDDYVSA
jgi:hypothetical protein